MKGVIQKAPVCHKGQGPAWSSSKGGFHKSMSYLLPAHPSVNMWRSVIRFVFV